MGGSAARSPWIALARTVTSAFFLMLRPECALTIFLTVALG